MERGGTVYIITNFTHTTFYTGVTSDITSRIIEHKEKHIRNLFLQNITWINLFIFVPLIR
ncbi:GIY-YIG nuclease family protein [Pedobacter sp. KLB.chiD]|uniref:GIY-YIG nuclease family protein n=1 Tax=Pedobacter sp. KLB.chiD TaxID=3387402 RepID=UPI0039998A67